MELKDYQIKVVAKLKKYLSALSEFREKFKKPLSLTPKWQWITIFPAVHGKKQLAVFIFQTKTVLAYHCPKFTLKSLQVVIKPFLACHSIDLINKTYLNKQTGLVLTNCKFVSPLFCLS